MTPFKLLPPEMPLHALGITGVVMCDVITASGLADTAASPLVEIPLALPRVEVPLVLIGVGIPLALLLGLGIPLR